MDFLELNGYAVVTLAINTLASMSYFYIYSSKKIKSHFFKLPQVLQKLYVAFFVLPIFIAPFIKQSKFSDYSLYLSLLGVILSIVGFTFIVMSFLKIGVVPSIKEKGGLSSTGVYGIVRHPIYAGTIQVQIGFTLLNQSLISLIYLPISVFLYFSMAAIEERDLEDMFGSAYVEYKEKVKKSIISFVL
jgi:protein-S-isoprenylcysteine O-methyltransferase Ste14